MWELLLYAMVAPMMTIILSLVFAWKYDDLFAAPMITFILFNLPTIFISMNYSIGWYIFFGWSIFYTFLSLFISLLVWLLRKHQQTSTSL
ncbi:DUF2651 family protein [Halalkalibacter sp. AB-rgal2]|uniref:DUF2651 family protein n=1 Tax=Halalkalibacter sp. AB-rgal2 TaxID=3242695 RepID=UPI00359E762F